MHGSDRCRAEVFLAAGVAGFVAVIAATILVFSPAIATAGVEQLQAAHEQLPCQA